jgi:5,10-methylenetetrahydromethanopterin reductase
MDARRSDVKFAASQLSVAFQSDKRLAEYGELAVIVERYGFGVVSIYGDLMFQPPLPALLAMATATSRIKLGPACLNPFTLHPMEIAGQIAMLDAASHGRAYLGLSRGAWLESIGIRPPRPITALRETAEIVRRLISGERDEFAGEIFSLEAHHALQYPVERSAVPLLIGTWGPRTAALAGEVASEVKVGGSANPSMVSAMRKWITVGTTSSGRLPSDVGIVLGAVTVVDRDGKAARARARTEVARYLAVVGPFDPTVSIEPELLARIQSAVLLDDFVGAGALIPDSLLDRFALAGTPDQVAEQTYDILAAGATRVEFGTPHGLSAREGLRLLGEQVLPALT